MKSQTLELLEYIQTKLISELNSGNPRSYEIKRIIQATLERKNDPNMVLSSYIKPFIRDLRDENIHILDLEAIRKILISGNFKSNQIKDILFSLEKDDIYRKLIDHIDQTLKTMSQN